MVNLNIFVMGELKKKIRELNSKKDKTQADKDRLRLLTEQREKIRCEDEDLEQDY